jgi:hypothetical protein
MERSEMLSLTSCALSHVTNVNNETELYGDTEPGHCTSILLVAVGHFSAFHS